MELAEGPAQRIEFMNKLIKGLEEQICERNEEAINAKIKILQAEIKELENIING